MYSAILEGKAATWFRTARTRSWFAAVLILALCALALSACGSGGNGGGEADGNATGGRFLGTRRIRIRKRGWALERGLARPFA